jgi:sensor domain CHASE-containing protein
MPSRLRRLYSRTPLKAAVALAVMLSLWWSGGQVYRRELLKEARRVTQIAIVPYGTALSAALNNRLALVDTLHAFVQADPNAPHIRQHFPAFAAGLLNSGDGIRSLLIAPGGVIRYIYPFEPNKGFLGYAIATNTDEHMQARRSLSLASGQTIVGASFRSSEGALIA